ncbi:ABC transporter permease subunit [Tautonia sp. JC769]|uniref:ABC transporter permease n=1 Tax=Tautonia sp. JC769 TaxID=3232135 RepID=UPI00345AAF5F
MALLTIVRKLLGETRGSLLISTLGFFGLALLWNWGMSEFQFPSDADEPTPSASADSEGTEREEPRRERRRGRAGPQIYVFFGVPAEQMLGIAPGETPTLAMQAAIANHPLVFLALLGWAISRASAAVAGEVERGTLDLTLSRPVRRSTFLAAQILATLIVFALLGLAITAGHLASARFIFRLNGTPPPLEYLPMVGSLVALGMAVFGYTLPISSGSLSRARSGIIGLAITLAGIAGMIFARQYEEYDWVANLSVFEFYAPVANTLDPTREQWMDLATLGGVFAVGSIASFLIFLRRDLPSNSG